MQRNASAGEGDGEGPTLGHTLPGRLQLPELVGLCENACGGRGQALIDGGVATVVTGPLGVRELLKIQKLTGGKFKLIGGGVGLSKSL